VIAIAVDPVHNVIVAGTTTKYEGDFGALLMYNRMDSGNVKPRGLIMGAKTGIRSVNQLQTYSPKGWIVATQPGDAYGEMEPENVFIGVWSVNDTGDVAPRWKLGGPNSVMKKPRGVALNVKDKELIVADMRLNAVLTYRFPEIF
jgi:hypothetical protein